MKYLISSIGLLLLAFTNVKAQEPPDIGGWYTLSVSKDIKDTGLSASTKFQHRNWEVIGELQQLFYNAELAYQFQDGKAKIGAGYVRLDFSGLEDEDKITRAENRSLVWAQTPQKVSDRLGIDHRLMFEQRWFKDQDIRTRVRIMQNGKWKMAKNATSKTPTLIVQNEVFINGQQDIGGGVSVPLFDQNRTIIAVKKPINQWLTLGLGGRHHVFNSYNRQVVDGSISIKL